MDDRQYTERLVRLQDKWWKRFLDVQAPYRWNLRRLRPGFTLEIGCGIGRNLQHLRGEGVGVDTSASSVEVARARGLRAFTPEAFRESEYHVPGRFDSILLSHVAEHMTRAAVVDLVRSYLPLVKPGGKTIFITPQEVGFRSDPTHVEFMDFAALEAVVRELGLRVERSYSFPFPRPVGRVFIYNEFVTVGART